MRTSLSSDEAADEALDYLAAGLPFHAHEVLEIRWRCCPTQERSLWRALAQAAAGCTHTARGNPVGAERLRERAQEGLAAYAGPTPKRIGELLNALGVDR